MYRGLALIISAGVLLGFLSSCATMNVPEKSGAGECLVVIKTKLLNPEDVDASRRYYFYVSGQDGSYSVPTHSEGMMLIKVENKQAAIEAISTNVQTRDAEGDYAKYEVDLDLPYKPGEVVIFDKVFVQHVKVLDERGDTMEVSTDIRFESILEPEKEELRERISESEQFQSWL